MDVLAAIAVLLIGMAAVWSATESPTAKAEDRSLGERRQDLWLAWFGIALMALAILALVLRMFGVTA